MERKLAAIVAGDVVGYSRLMADDEAATYNALRSALAEVVEPAIRRHAGRIFKSTGDGFLATFPSVNEALDAAIEVRDGFAQRVLQLRLGINLGDVIEENGDVFGDGVNVAARLESMAEPGSIYVSAAVVRSTDKNRHQMFQRIGHRQAKNMPGPIEVYVVRSAPASTGLAAGTRRMSRYLDKAQRHVALAGLAAAIAAGAVWVVAGDWIGQTLGQPQRPVPLAAERPAADSRPTVAVLPFDNLSGDPAQAYFSDGLTEDIITDLARNRELMVIARNSTFAFKDSPMDLREVGAVLGAGYVVEGSARRAGDQLRVVAQLIDAETGTHLWSRSYDRRYEDVFAVQTDLTEQIVASLVSYVRQSETDALADRPTQSLRAYDLVLQGRDLDRHGKTDPDALRRARALYEQALRIDPDYAAAHAYLGLTYIVEGLGSAAGPVQADLERGLAESRRAIQLEPDLSLGYQVLSFALAVSGDYEGSLHAGQRAVELNPSDPDSLMALAKAQVRFGRYADAVTNAERALRLHPMAPEYYAYVYGQALYAADRPAEADEVIRQCLLRAPGDANCLKIQAAVLVRLDRPAEARDAMTRLLQVEPAFSLSTEAATRRFGDSPLMERYLSDLTRADAPASSAGLAAAKVPRDT